MSRPHQSLLLGLVAVLLLRLSLTDEFLSYVKPVMQPFLVVAGLILAVVALAPFLSGTRRASPVDAEGSPLDLMPSDPGHDPGHGDGGDHGPPHLAWLLVIPIATAFIVAPGSLGSFAAERGASWVPQTPTVDSGWPPPMRSPVEGAYEVGLNDVNIRAYYDEAASLQDKPLRLVGFVRSDPDAPGEFLLTRFMVSCCAADAVPVSVRVTGAEGPLPPDESWVEVEGTWVPNALDPAWEGIDDTDWATVEATTIIPIAEPREPYEPGGS